MLIILFKLVQTYLLSEPLLSPVHDVTGNQNLRKKVIPLLKALTRPNKISLANFKTNSESRFKSLTR